jgi:hypothetical protein
MREGDGNIVPRILISTLHWGECSVSPFAHFTLRKIIISTQRIGGYVDTRSELNATGKRKSTDPDVIWIPPDTNSCSILTTGPKPLPKRFLHIVRSRASSFKWEYPLLSLRSSSSFLRLLPHLLRHHKTQIKRNRGYKITQKMQIGILYSHWSV